LPEFIERMVRLPQGLETSSRAKIKAFGPGAPD
jgi:hypothetical protein